MAVIRQLASFAVLSVNGGERISYTYDEIDSETGAIVSQNKRGNFYAVDRTLKTQISKIRDYIQTNKLDTEV